MYSISGITADCTKRLSTLLNKLDKDKLQNMHAKPTEYKDTGNHRKMSGFGGGRKRESNRGPLDDYDVKEDEQKRIYFDFSIRFVTINDLFIFFQFSPPISSADRSAQMY